MTEVLVFSNHRSIRLQYTLHWILCDRFGLDFKITDSIHEFESFPGVKINYSNQPGSSGLNITSGSILYDTLINENFGEIGEWNGLKTIFKTENNGIPFDIFGAVFYCISRMEEYGATNLDSHQRYKHINSILSKLNVLQTPLVDLWLEEFKIVLLSFYPSLRFKAETFKFINTFDIDQAFCFKGKGFWRSAGGLYQDLFNLRLRFIKERVVVLLGFKQDPYDTFDYIVQKHKELNLNTIVFLLLADYGTYDKNIAVSNPLLIERIKLLNENVNLGIYPSYYSFKDARLMRKEIKRLADIQIKQVTESRQHYLKLEMPETFRNLLDAGITHEYSLGYADAIGFRAGTSHPYHWFDIEKNEVTILEIHPCCVMDVTLKNYLKQSPLEAKETIHNLIGEVEKVDGTFISIWHNESISNYGEWEGWRDVYEDALFRLQTLV